MNNNYFVPPRGEQSYPDLIARLYPSPPIDANTKNLVRTVTLQVTDDCCMACTYCYQHNKKHHSMSFETAKKFVDFVLDVNNPYVNPSNSPGIIFDFIGGEPLMEIHLISQIADYITQQLIELNHPWLFKHRFSMCSNGLLYFKPEVQNFLSKYGSRLSFSISIDGDQKLHDACRIDLEGKGTYERAMAAVNHFRDVHHGSVGSKMTLSPNNITFTAQAVQSLLDNKYTTIHLNCVYEEGWQEKHGSILYNELKQIANYMICNNLYKTHDVSMFKYDFYSPMLPSDNDNWCGGVNGSMLAVDYKGDLFPCLRYMESSIPENREPIIIGNLSHGLFQTEKEKFWQQELNGVTRQLQSTEECWNCPIARGCSWCSAYNYEVFGTVRKRATFICPMHKATSLANAYYWNLVFIKENDTRRFKIWLSDEEALKFVSQEELNLLHFLENFPIDIDMPELLDIINQFNDINDLESIITAYREVKQEMGE